MKIHRSLKKHIDFIGDIILRFNAVGCSYRAAALSFTSLLSLVPLLTVSFVMLAAFPEFKAVAQTIQNFIFNNFVATAGQTIQHYLASFVENAAQLSAISLCFLFVTAVSLLFLLEQTLNAIWQVRTPRRWLSAFFLYWTILTLSPILIGVSFVATSHLISTFPLMTKLADNIGLTKPIIAFLPFSLSIIAFSLLYIAVPNRKVPLKAGLLGALVASILFEIAKFGFAVYLLYFPTYKFLYGAFAAIPIFLLWVYICWYITLIGAVVSFVLTKRD